MILCLGTTPTVQRSMIFDRFEINDVNRAAEVREYASGKSPNVARVLKSLGADPLEVGFVGGDRGRFLLVNLQAAGIRCDFVVVNATTRLCTTVIDRATGTATELVEESAPLTQADWDTMDQKLAPLLTQASIWIFSGSLPPGAPQEFYAKWLPLAVSQKATVILDARGEPLQLALKHRGFIAKLNRQELAATVGRPLEAFEDFKTAVREIATAAGAAIVTMGSEGALASDGRSIWRLIPPKVKAISAVGSGDAFAAGLALELSRGRALEQSLPYAAACGAANALTALAGHLKPDDVIRLSREAQIKLM